MSGSRSRSQTRSDVSTQTQNLNLQEIDGVAVAGVDGGVNIETTDSGTVDAARQIALTGLDVGATGFQEAADVASDAIASGERQTGDVLDFARDAQSGVFELVQTSNRDALDVVQSSNREALEFSRDIAIGFQDSVEGLADNVISGGQQLLADVIEITGSAGRQVVDSVTAIQARESTNTDARLEEITRFALIGAGVLGLAAVVAATRK